MFRKRYKEDFDSITPDPDVIDNLSEKLKSHALKKYPRIGKHLIAAAVVVCLLMSVGLMTRSFHEPSFAMVAFADDNSDDKVYIDENSSVVLPFGKISRGEKHSYIDKHGKMVCSYDSGFEHGSISIEGEGISSVTYACKMGEFSYYDSVMKKRMEDEGKIKVCVFTVPVKIIPLSDDMDATFERLWNEGYFDDIKKDYFQDKSTDISDYEVMFAQTGEQLEKGIWRVEISHKFENGYPFRQRSNEVTAAFYEECGTTSFDVTWSPWYALDMVSEDKPIDFADLPSDDITVTVHFTNGKTATKQLKFSFDSNGNLIAEVVKN
ncbi:MAG: hypothetical protein PHE70_03235 [Tepidanaerobacteraceae bacterium]|nr:hypothetical protein [Tepidanaerobacteraceae bacterium]